MNRFNTLTAFINYLLILSFQLNGRVSTQLVQENVQAINITRSDNLDSGDKVNLLLVNSSLCQDQNAVDTGLSADCNLVSQGTDDSGQDFCNTECVCNNETGSFIVHEKRCGDERELRQGCDLVFGSWSWNSGWAWNSQSDRLLTLYLEDGFGFGGGFNASTEEYSECRHTRLSTYDATGGWSVFTIPANESFITFFKMRGYWHFYWIIEDLSESKKSEIEGKFIKLDVTCENLNETNGIVEVTQLSSCLVFKVTGNISHEYNLTSASSDVYPSTTVIPVLTTTNVPIQSTSEHIQPSVTTAEPTSSLAISYITATPSQSGPVIMSSSILESSSVIESSSVVESSSATESNPVAKNSSAIQDNPVIQRSSVIESTPVILNSPVIESTPVLINSPIIQSSTVMQSSPVIKSNLVVNSSSVFNSMAQSTQAVQPTSNDDQIGLVLGIVVACSAAVVIAIAAIVLTVTSLYNSHVKRTQLIQNDANSISMAMKSFDKYVPTPI